ncbi:MAG: hypothetical protein DSY66_01720 [Persephonella sp.]|nr:MAG: hypothetical protein DSY53_00245 [Persephonella sp.]RUM61586.1 MAG: hypothetical protein DSY66_01720 [Persephonella sp.]
MIGALGHIKNIIKLQILFLVIFINTTSASEIKILKFVCSEDVVNRQPVNVSNVFKTDIDKIYCFTKVKADKTPTYIYHVWYKNDKKVFEVKLNIRYSTYRTWSFKRISNNDVGNWRVELLDENKSKIAEVKFKVVKGENDITLNINETNTEKDNEKLEKKDLTIKSNFNVNIKNNTVKDIDNSDKENKLKINQLNINSENLKKDNKDFISKNFYLLLLIAFYVIFFPSVYLIYKKFQS